MLGYLHTFMGVVERGYLDILFLGVVERGYLDI